MLLNGLFLAIFGWKWWFLDRLPLAVMAENWFQKRNTTKKT
jgi:hypothetical protein